MIGYCTLKLSYGNFEVPCSLSTCKIALSFHAINTQLVHMAILLGFYSAVDDSSLCCPDLAYAEDVLEGFFF